MLSAEALSDCHQMGFCMGDKKALYRAPRLELVVSTVTLPLES